MFRSFKAAVIRRDSDAASEERTVIVLLSSSSRRWISAAAISIACALSLAGCNRGPAMYHVKGHVFYKDGTVPAGAIQRGPDGTFVYRVAPDQTVSPAAVRTGPISEGVAVIESGLAEGARVVR